MVGTPRPGHLRLLYSALDVFCFLVYALVLATEHFFESVEVTFHYARCVLCFNLLNKNDTKKHHFFPYKLVQTYYSFFDMLYVLYSILEFICSTYAQSLAKDIAQVFDTFS